MTGLHTIRATRSPSFISSGQLCGTGYTLQFTTAGTYQYDCMVHGQLMTGTIVVR